MMRAVFLICLALAASPAVAQAIDNAPLHAVAALLRPGDFRWGGDVFSAEPVTVDVSLTLQRAYVYRGPVLIGVAAVSTGRAGHGTPSGRFTVLQKARWHRSNLYSGAPMPFMQRLTWDGVALHAGHDPGFPASHGCVRLPPAFARDLFDLTAVGTSVTIGDYPADTPQLRDDLFDSGGGRLPYVWSAVG